ncbi:MAG: TIR domain-containing protein [Desulfobacterales bacterium]|nr:TIR domain-containing protein [Desulfobacterales bacterium]
MKEVKVFISYATEDYEIAKKLCDDLKKEDIQPWIDREDLLVGQNWREIIPQVIRDSSYFLLLISEHSVSNQGYVQKEQKIALDHYDEFPLNQIYIIPARIDDTQPLDEKLKNLHWADLSDYKKGYKQIMKVLDKEYIDEQEEKTEFANRLHELEITIHDYCPTYLLITAPMGYGKTTFLKEVEKKLKRKKWRCFNIILSKDSKNCLLTEKCGEEEVLYGSFSFETPENAGSELGNHILTILHEEQTKVLIQMDEAENLDKNLVKGLLNQFTLAIADTLNNADMKLRLVFAGRYISDWQKLSYQIRFKTIMLGPFDFETMYQSVEHFDFSSKKVPMRSEYKKEFSAWLMYFTGGHPRSMSEILIKNYRQPMNMIAKKEKEIYDNISPVIEDIKTHIPPDLKAIFEALSVVRRFNASMLRNFIDSGIIRLPGDKDWNEYDLEDQLYHTYLVSKKDGFLQDDITRRLLAIDLQRTEPDRFIQICESAVSFYEKILTHAESYRRAVIAVELLFQKLQYVVYKENAKKEQFFDYLENSAFAILKSGQDAIMVIDSFIQLLNEDWEFHFTFNCLFREGSYNERTPYNELMERADNLLESLKKGPRKFRNL